MVKGKGFTRTGPDAAAKFLEKKGEGFRTKHAGGLKANVDEVVVFSAGSHTWPSSAVLPALPPIQKPRQCGKGPEYQGM